MCKQAVKIITALFTIVLIICGTMVTGIYADETTTINDEQLGHETEPEYTFTETTAVKIPEGMYYYEIDYTNSGSYVGYSASYGDITIRIKTGSSNSTATGYVYIPDFQDAYTQNFDIGSDWITEVRLYKGTLGGLSGVGMSYDSTAEPAYTISGNRNYIEPGYYYIDVPFGVSVKLSSGRNPLNSDFVIVAAVGSRPSGNYTGLYIYLPETDDLSSMYKYRVVEVQETVNGQIQEVDTLTTPVNMYPATLTLNNEYYNQGYNDGYEAGQEVGYNEGYTAGETAGQEAGYNQGYTAGESAGYENGYDEGYQAGLELGTGSYNEGYQAGFADGTINGQNVDEIVGNGISGFFEGMKAFFEPFLLVGIGDLTIANMFYLGLFLAFIVFIVKLIRG